MDVRLSLFGPPLALIGERTVALACERRTQLLVYLAVKRTWVARSELAALLWPDQQPRLAYTNLRKALFRLQAFAWAEHIEAQGSALRFEADTDVLAFETALREQRLADAIDLYRGDLLTGFDDDDNEAWSGWLGFERDRLRLAWRGAIQQRLEGDVDASEATNLAARWLASDPLDETALRSYMQWLVRAGQGGRASQAYREFVARLRDELGLEPGTELVALHDSLIQRASPTGMAAEAPKRTSIRDGFIGRTVEMRRIVALLEQDDCRLLSIVGSGGVGKTRLALHAMRELAASYADGALFVPLEDVASGAELGGQLAHELKVPLKDRADALEQVIGTLRERQMLLVLDNFEHLAGAAAMLERLLDECAHLQIVVTSRVRLALAREWLLPLEGLPCPEEEDRDRIEAFDAARLFVRAARRVQPNLAPAAEAAAIVDICRQLQGLPLALELAAAWTRVLSCEDIATELRGGAELLHSTDASPPSRHASMDIVFEHSWQLLGAAERAALARLAVFRGGFTAHAARAVSAVALPVLAALADKSLLRKEGPRCFLHPLVHQFARVRLEQQYDATGVETAHGRYFLRRLAELMPRLRQADPPTLQDVDADFENIRAAWHLAIDNDLTDDLARAAYSLMTYCEHRGRQHEGLALLLAAVDGGKAALPALAAPAAWLAFRLDRYADAEALGITAMNAIGPYGRDATAAFRAATVLGAACARLGRGEEAQRWFRQALELAQRTGDPLDTASALDNLGMVARGRGDLEEALGLYRKALLKHREAGDAGGAAMCLNNEAVIHITRQDLDAAQRALREARQLCDRHGLPGTQCMVEVNLANVATLTGAPERAVQHALKALELSAQTGRRGNEVDARHALVEAALRRQDLGAARTELARALTVSISIARLDLIAHGVRLFANIAIGQGRMEIGTRVFRFLLRQPGLAAAERAEVERQLAAWDAQLDRDGDWTGPSIDELAHRIVAETDQAYEPLLSRLSGGSAAGSRLGPAKPSYPAAG